MHVLSRVSPCFYTTSAAKDRLPVFRTDEIKLVTCRALDEARRSGQFALYAYVIMPDHIHVITNSILPLLTNPILDRLEDIHNEFLDVGLINIFTHRLNS